MLTVEVCLSPALFEFYQTEGTNIVVVDIFRATTSICAAFEKGVGKIIPVASMDEAKQLKEKGFLVAAERDGKVLDFADFGNSPDDFIEEKIKGNTVVYCTTNGTQAIAKAGNKGTVVIGSFSNLSALCEWLSESKKNIVFLCSGWKNRFNLEDTLFCGAVYEKLLQQNNFTTQCDATLAAYDLWLLAKDNLKQYLDKASHRKRLEKIHQSYIIDFCLTADTTKAVPVLKENYLTDLSKELIIKN